MDTGAKDAGTTHATTVETTTAAKDSTMGNTATATEDSGAKTTTATGATTTMGGGTKTKTATGATTTMSGHGGKGEIATPGSRSIDESGAETIDAEEGEGGIASRIARLLKGLLAMEGH